MEEMRGEREGGGLITKPQEITPIVARSVSCLWWLTKLPHLQVGQMASCRTFQEP